MSRILRIPFFFFPIFPLKYQSFRELPNQTMSDASDIAKTNLKNISVGNLFCWQGYVLHSHRFFYYSHGFRLALTAIRSLVSFGYEFKHALYTPLILSGGCPISPSARPVATHQKNWLTLVAPKSNLCWLETFENGQLRKLMLIVQVLKILGLCTY
jgi:hypothetical protein